jgi:hypothetical protein
MTHKDEEHYPMAFNANLTTPIQPSNNMEYPYSHGTTPNMYSEAMMDKTVWKPVMQKEYDGLQAINAWTLVLQTKDMNVTGCKWAYARKFDNKSNWKPKA